MASKSKRRGRVFRASCILAALIIAGSSFAWFTSSDEVTNRLSANADYDVRIVESFAPPKNFIPGQEVNKDVYAVNTGTVPAYVEEAVSGVMTITKETKVDTLDADCTKLTAAERYVMEAGSYLAYVPTGSTKIPGEKIVSMVTDPSDLDKYTTADLLTDFAPDETGVYIFRRSIDVASSDHSETFEYEGYYYDKTSGDFYKIELTSVTPDNDPDFADDGKRTDGNLTGETHVFLKDVTTTAPANLTYDAANKRLVATVAGQAGPTDAELENYGSKYDTAKHDYEFALAKQTAAMNEDSAASNDEKTALATLNGAKAAEATAQSDYDKALASYTKLNKQRRDLATELGDASSGVTQQKEDIQQALYGNTTNTPDSLPGTFADRDHPTQAEIDDATTGLSNGLYKDMMEALVTKNAQNANTTEFLTELTTYYNNLKATRNADADLNNDLPNLSGSPTVNEIVGNLSYADVAAFSGYTEQHGDFAADAAYITAKKAYDDKVADYNVVKARFDDLTSRLGNGTGAAGADEGLTKAVKEKFAELYGSGTGAPTWSDDYIPSPAMTSAVAGATDLTNRGLYGDLYNAKIDTANAQADYDTKKGTADTKNAQLNAANADVASKKAALEAAKKDYNDAVAAYNAAGDVVIYVNLDPTTVTTEGGTAGKWQILPSTVEGNKAYFYYTNILEGGETSNKLIDSVTLAPTVTQDMYKSFDFDLNVELKSAQITYADDNETITTDSVAAGQLDANSVVLANPKDVNTALTWTKAFTDADDRAGTTYSAEATDNSGAAITGGVTVTKIATIAKTGEPSTTYQYTITTADGTFYGNSLTSGTVFKKGTISGDTVSLDTQVVTLTSTATKD